MKRVTGVHVHVAIDVELFFGSLGLVQESACVATAIVVGLDPGIGVVGDHVPEAGIERGGGGVMRGEGATLLVVKHGQTAYCVLLLDQGGTDPGIGPRNKVLRRKGRKILPRNQRKRHLQRRLNPGKRGKWTDHCVQTLTIVFM